MRGATPHLCVNIKIKYQDMTLRLNKDGKYFTRNMYLTAYLYFIGYDFTTEADGDRIEFLVDVDEKSEQIINTFLAGGILVEPQEYANALKEVKKKMYANR